MNFSDFDGEVQGTMYKEPLDIKFLLVRWLEVGVNCWNCRRRLSKEESSAGVFIGTNGGKF